MIHEKSLRFSFRKRVAVILQTEACECGLACLAMISDYHGHSTNLAELRKRFPVSLKGATLLQLIQIAHELNLVYRPLRVELRRLDKVKLPAMLHWNMNHFVVLTRVGNGKYYVNDPAQGELVLDTEHISEHFTGVVLELAPGLSFERKAAPASMKFGKVVGKIVGLKRGLLQSFVLAIVLEALSLSFPLISQWVTDEAIVSNDVNLLGALCIGLILIGFSSAIISAIRSWIGIYISTNFNMQWMSNVMAHLLRLPVVYFERRHLGDIVSRFGAVREIERGLTSGGIDAALDGLLAVGTLIMMVLYSPSLAAMTVATVVAYVALRWLRYGTSKIAMAGAILKKAREQSYFLETIRGVRSIKLFNGENNRRTNWINLWVESANADLVSQKLALTFNLGWSFFSTVERAGTFWLGATLVMENKMSLGMLFAFIAYKEQFAARFNSLVDRFIEFKMLSVQAERLSDIVLASVEDDSTGWKVPMPDNLTISAENLSFRYHGENTDVLKDLNIKINFGECVALVGPSGGGKTTCLKVFLGILKAQKGSIKIGGLSLEQIGLRNYRELTAAVMQDDSLFSGSIYDNISFFDPKPDEAWLYDCARAANIHNEIMAMPMGYHTFVGDMGTVLSGGQKQRVMLARALYRKPKILFLDEATSHLDQENEILINSAISALKITRILIAHRPQTIGIADRIIRVSKGELVEQAKEPQKSMPPRTAAIAKAVLS